MRIFLILILLGLISVAQVYSQASDSFSDRTPSFTRISTPNAASFEKYIDNPVGLYNGSIDVSIPIYTLKDIDVELPITLRYNTSGIKVSEESSWVGLGWNLNAGGVITQNVVGEYDGYDGSYNSVLNILGITDVYNPYYVPLLSGDCVLPLDNLYTKNAEIGRWGKLNPDVFYYSYPGGSGKFIFDYRNDSIYILDRESAEKIEVNGRSSVPPYILEFKITTTTGVQHYFQYFTRLYSNFTSRIYSVSYVLHKSVYPNNQIVSYTYDSKAIRKFSRSHIFQASISDIEDYCDLMGISFDVATEAVLEGEEFYLSSIKTNNYQINFETSERIDLMNGRKLDTIKIYPKNNINDANKIKEFVFEYDHFTADANTIGWRPEVWNTSDLIYTEDQNLQRLKLLAVYEQNNTIKNNKYNFTYNETDRLPAKTSYSVDYWGYHNRQNGTSYLPDLRRLLWGSMSLNDEITEKIVKKWTTPLLRYTNRGYDFNSCMAGILTKITYPTSGTKEIIYEPNTFGYPTKLPTATDDLGVNYGMPSYYVYDYNQQGSTENEHIFTIKDNWQGKLKMVLSRGQHTGSHGDGHFWYNLIGSSVTIINQANGHHIQHKLDEYITNKVNCIDSQICDDSDPGNLSVTVEIPSTFLIPGTYKLIASLPGSLPDQSIGVGPAYANLSATLALCRPPNVYIPSTSQLVQGCGLRVTQIITDFGDNNKTNTFFEYSGGILHDVLQYVKVHDIGLCYESVARHVNSVPCYVPDENGALFNIFIRKKKVVEVFGNNTMSNPYASIGGVGYSLVREATTSNDNNQGWTISEFNNTTPHTTQESVRIDNPLNGKLVKTTFYLNDSTVKKEVRYNYSSNVAHRYFGINVRKTANEFLSVFQEDNINFISPNIIPLLVDNLFAIIAHPLNAYDILLNSITTTIDNITVMENYTYNPVTLQLKSKTISKSDGGNLEYKYFYPNDYNFLPYTSMKAANILSPMIEEKVYSNDLYIGGSLTKYGFGTQGNTVMYAPQRKYYSNISVPLSTPPTTFSSSGENTNIYPSANITFGNRTVYGKPQSITYNGSNRIVYLWGYNYQYPIAEIKNATFAEVEAAAKTVFSVASTAALAALLVPNESKLQDGGLQNALPNALVTTYTYKSLVGMTSSTDPNGMTTYYRYDNFERLDKVEIGEINSDGTEVKHKLQEHNYHYKNQ